MVNSLQAASSDSGRRSRRPSRLSKKTPIVRRLGVAVAYVCVRKGGRQAQVSAIEAWAKFHRLEIICWSEDEGATAELPVDRRPGLVEAMQKLDEHAARWLVVQNRRVLTREPLVGLLLDRNLSELGVGIVAADGSDEARQPLLESIMEAVSEQEQKLFARERKRCAQGDGAAQRCPGSGVAVIYGARWNCGACYAKGDVSGDRRIPEHAPIGADQG